MVNFAQGISFILNDKAVSASVPPGTLVLDYLRKERQLTGTKEGCKEGDCGACSVVLGELKPDGTVGYRPMTSCLMPMGELEGKHLVSIEGLNMEKLSPVQDAMVDCGGTQCGYCTPGFIVSMTAGLMEPKVPLNEEGMLYAISGNLCRCTGYRSIKEAGMQAINGLADQLIGSDRIADLCDAQAIPEYFRSIPERLSEMVSSSPISSYADPEDALFIAGGTDLYVQRGEEIPDLEVNLLNLRGEAVSAARLEDGKIVLDARMSFEAFANDPIVIEAVPEIGAYNELIASWPVRTRATLAGNICNASPIADMTCLLMALGTELTLSAGGRVRTVALKEFYPGYKKLNKTAEERVISLSFEKVSGSESVSWEKVSKRAWLDIATVNAAGRISLLGDTIESASLALGGVAATPLYLSGASGFLAGKALIPETILSMLDIALGEFDPISDVRGSADYKKLLARQLLLALFETKFADQLDMEAVYASL